MDVYTEAMQGVTDEITAEHHAALGRVIAQHHQRLVADLADLIHEEVMEVRRARA